MSLSRVQWVILAAVLCCVAVSAFVPIVFTAPTSVEQSTDDLSDSLPTLFRPGESVLRDMAGWAKPKEEPPKEEPKIQPKAEKKTQPVGPSGPQKGRLQELWLEQLRYRLVAVYKRESGANFAVLSELDVPTGSSQPRSLGVGEQLGSYQCVKLSATTVTLMGPSDEVVELELFDFESSKKG